MRCGRAGLTCHVRALGFVRMLFEKKVGESGTIRCETVTVEA